MSRGDDFPRYTYMMDFNPMDEDTPLRDYWQTTDDLDNEDAATIASLATQVLQAKSGYEYGEAMGVEVNEPGVVANYMYSESRSSPQSQYSTTLPAEPAESFRGLMEDHDRGVQMLGESAASEYDFEPEARGHESSDVNGIDEPTMLSREQYAPESLRSTLNVAAEVDVTNQSSYTREIEMSAAMTASRVVNGVLSRSYAGTPTEEAVNLQALQSHTPQLTPPQSESRSVSVETPDYAEQEQEQEQEPTMETDEQQVDDEPENAIMTEDDEGKDWEEDEGGEREENEGREREEDEGEEREEDEEEGEGVENEGGERVEDEGGEKLEDEGDGQKDEGDRKEDEGGEREGDEGGETEKDEMDEEEPTPDTGAQQQLITESNERSAVDDEELPLLQQTPRKRGRPRRSDAVEAPPALTSEPPKTTQLAVREKDTHAGNEEVESAVTDGADLKRAEEIPTGRKRGRPRKSEISEPVTATAPTPAKRGPGRPPKATDIELTLEATPVAGKRGRPRKNSTLDATQLSAIALELSSAGKRGRPRKNSMVAATQLSAIALELSATETPTATPPRKSKMVDAATQTSISPTQLPVAETTGTGEPSGKRGRPRKSDVLDSAQASTNADEEATITPLTSTHAAQGAVIAPARTSSKRGRPRKSDMTGAAQASAEELEIPAVEVAETGAPSGKRGRPRKSDAAANEVQGAVVTEARASSKRGRPRKSDTMGATHASIEELQLSAAEAPVTTTPASSKRGRPRKSDAMGATPAQVPTHEAQLPVDEAPPTIAPALGEIPPKASVTTSTTTPGKRGRPAKSAVPLLQTEIEISRIEDASLTADSPALKSIGRRGRPPRQADTLEERAGSPTPLPTKKRGRGRPSKSESLLPADLPSATLEAGLGMGAQEAEPQEPPTPMDEVLNDLAVGEAASTLAQEDMEATPARKRGRPRAATVDKPLSVMDMLVTASEKKHGRPPKAIANIDSAEEHGQPVQSEAQEKEEEPAAKRRRTNNDTTMEDAVDEDEARGNAQEDDLPNVEDLEDVVAANGATRKRSSVTWAQPLTSTLTEPKAVAIPSPQLDRRPRLSGETLEESTRTKQVEQPPTAPPRPKTLFDMISDGRKMARQKTYGKRSKR